LNPIGGPYFNGVWDLWSPLKGWGKSPFESGGPKKDLSTRHKQKNGGVGEGKLQEGAMIEATGDPSKKSYEKRNAAPSVY